VIAVAGWSRGDAAELAVGARFSLEGASIAALVHEASRPVRVDSFADAHGPIAEEAQQLRIRSSVGCPIVVEGRLWGVIAASSKSAAPFPPDTESQIAEFTELVATAIANAEAQARANRLTSEQAALRRVATLVAREASHAEVFSAIADEVGQLLGAEDVRIYRYEDDHSVVVVGASGYDDFLPVGSRHPLGGTNSASLVFRTGQAARIDDYETAATGSIGDQARSSGIRSIVAAPILVEGRLWGAIAVGTGRLERLPPETEGRLGQFTELAATAIANTESHARADQLADEQAALRRVATLVAEASPLEDVFAKIAEEVAAALGDVDCALWRDEGDGTASAVAVWGASVVAGVRVGTRIALDGESVTALVLREGRPWRIDDYSGATGTVAERAREIGIRSAVGCPIMAGGRIWGVMAVASSVALSFPPETESRIAQFSELVATAIANIEARAEVHRLAEEQAALRRVATLVAEGAGPAAVFDAAAAEMERLLDAEQVSLGRYEPGDEITMVAHRGPHTWRLPPGSRLSHEGENVTAMVRQTERPARMESFDDATGPIARIVRAMGVRSSVGAPIVVDGRLWGVVTARWSAPDSPPADTEDRMAQFAQLLDTAIANADSHDQLAASRARLLTEGDEARRRVVRDLHDGAQRRLVNTIITLKLVQRALREKDAQADALVGDALAEAQKSNEELRELAHGILPAVLSRGLRAAIDEVVMGRHLPVSVDVPAERFPAEIEASAYFVVAEALTNVVKHAHASRADVTASVQDGMLRVEVQDDGIGGADPNGHGLVGIYDRVTALGGRLKIESLASGGMLVTATLPVSAS